MWRVFGFFCIATDFLPNVQVIKVMALLQRKILTIPHSFLECKTIRSMFDPSLSPNEENVHNMAALSQHTKAEDS